MFATPAAAHPKCPVPPRIGCCGEYIKVHRTAVPCSSRAFSELWAHRPSDAAAAREAPPPITCALLRAASRDARTRAGSDANVQLTVLFSPNGEVSNLKAPPNDNPHYSYTFNAPGSAPRCLHVRAPGNHTWTTSLYSGDLLEYRRTVGNAGAGNRFRLQAATDPARCNGQRIIITVAMR